MKDPSPKKRALLNIDKLRELEKFVTEFIDQHGYGSGECIGQADSASIEGPVFIDGICQIVGYAEDK